MCKLNFMMAKLNVMQSNQIFMAWLGIYSNHSTKRSNEFFQSPKTYFIVGTMTMCSISFLMELFSSSSTFAHKIDSLLICVGMSEAICVFLNFGIKTANIKSLQLKLQAIVNEGDDENIFNLYWNAEQKCRKYTKIIPIGVFSCGSAAYVAVFLYSIYCLCSGNVDASTWPEIFDLEVSGHTYGIIRWYFGFCVTFIMDSAYILYSTSATTYFICSCIYIGAICEHFCLLMDSMQEYLKRNQREKNPQMREKNIHRIRTRIHQAIGIHVKIYDVFEAVADVNSGSIFFLAGASYAVPLAASMYRLEHAASDSNFVDVFYNVLATVSIMIWPFLFCKFADFVVDRIAILGNVAYDLDWYEYPHELRKHFILIIARSLGSVNFSGFGLIDCTLVNFGKIFKTSCSYYLIFRKL